MFVEYNFTIYSVNFFSWHRVLLCWPGTYFVSSSGWLWTHALLPPQLPKGWDYRHELLSLAENFETYITYRAADLFPTDSLIISMALPISQSIFFLLKKTTFHYRSWFYGEGWEWGQMLRNILSFVDQDKWFFNVYLKKKKTLGHTLYIMT